MMDMDGGGRTFCHKFGFVCHNLRVCQAFEPRIYVKPPEDDSGED